MNNDFKAWTPNTVWYNVALPFLAGLQLIYRPNGPTHSNAAVSHESKYCIKYLMEIEARDHLEEEHDF